MTWAFSFRRTYGPNARPSSRRGLAKAPKRSSDEAAQRLNLPSPIHNYKALDNEILSSRLYGYSVLPFEAIPLECEKTASRRSNLALFRHTASYDFSIAGGGSVLIALHHLAQMTRAILVAALLGESRLRILQARLQHPSYSF
ncbi:hypothetical protein GOC38_28920 [Sinorhizobium meliloti]|nr:hypothetical protein [Sinorhizobium meliloti]MDX0327996.1 hypothetical protein [Sinorhizobium meliloti]